MIRFAISATPWSTGGPRQRGDDTLEKVAEIIAPEWSLGGVGCAATNCSNSTRWIATAVSRSARCSSRHSVDGLARDSIRPEAVISAGSWRNSP